jgi:hypothetical protein
MLSNLQVADYRSLAEKATFLLLFLRQDSLAVRQEEFH